MEVEGVIIVDSDEECFIAISDEEDASDDVRVIEPSRVHSSSRAAGCVLSDVSNCRGVRKSKTRNNQGTQTNITALKGKSADKTIHSRRGQRACQSNGKERVSSAKTVGGPGQNDHTPASQAQGVDPQPLVIDLSDSEDEVDQPHNRNEPKLDAQPQDKGLPLAGQPNVDDLDKENWFTICDNYRKKTNVMAATTLTPLRELPRWPTRQLHSPTPAKKMKLHDDKDKTHGIGTNDCFLSGKFTMISLPASSPRTIYSDISDAEEPTDADISNTHASHWQQQNTYVSKYSYMDSSTNCDLLPTLVTKNESAIQANDDYGKERSPVSSEQQHYSDISDDELPDLNDDMPQLLPVTAADEKLNYRMPSWVKTQQPASESHSAANKCKTDDYCKKTCSPSVEQQYYYSDISDDELPDLDSDLPVPLPLTADDEQVNSVLPVQMKKQHVVCGSRPMLDKLQLNSAPVFMLERLNEPQGKEKITANQINTENCHKLIQRFDRLRSVCRQVSRSKSVKDFSADNVSKCTNVSQESESVEMLSKRDRKERHFLDALSRPTLPHKRPRMESVDSTSDTNRFDDDIITLATDSDDSDLDDDLTIVSGSSLVRSDSLESVELYRDGKLLSGRLERMNCKTSSITDNVQLSPPPSLLRRTLSESSLESVEVYKDGHMVWEVSQSERDSLNSSSSSESESELGSVEELVNNLRCVKFMERRGRFVKCKSRNLPRKLENTDMPSAPMSGRQRSACISTAEEYPTSRHQSSSVLSVGEQLSQRNVCITANTQHPALRSSSCHYQNARTFSERYRNAVDACKEENCSDVEQASSLTRDFTTLCRCPGQDDIRYIISEVLLKSRNVLRTNRAYAVLKHIEAMHAPYAELPFDWDFLVDLVDSMHLHDKTQDLSCLHLTNHRLALKYVVSMFESELIGHSFRSQRQVSKSLVFRWFSTETQFGRVKKIIQWLGDAVQVLESDELTPALYKLNLHGEKEQGRSKVMNSQRPTGEIVHLFQKLLELSVMVCHDPLASAVRMTTELARLYLFLPSLATKRLLLDSLTSPLLREKLTQRLLDDHCSNDMVPLNLSGPVTLEDIMNHYFNTQPPRNTLTPPPSPNSDMDIDAVGLAVSDSCMLSESCEEMLLLVSTLVESYLAFSAGKLHRCVSKQLLSQDKGLSLEDQKTLKQLPRYVEELKRRLSQQCSTQLSHRSQLYLTRLHCLANLSHVAPS